MAEFSISPSGERFPLPAKEQYQAEFERIESLVQNARKEGKEIVVVMGVGFVGVVMAAIIADTVDKKTRSPANLSSAVKGQVREATGRYRFLIAGNRR